ncbi:MAG: flagellar export chaperone FliS [Phycisphaerae bacterium]
MSVNVKASQEYLKNAVMTATNEQLQLMLYDGAARFATQGMEAIRRSDFEGSHEALTRAQKIVVALHDGLRREVNPQLVDEMGALYAFVFRRLVDANMNRDVQAAEDALKILRHLRQTWVLLMDKVASERAKSSPAPTDTPTSDKPAAFSVEC